LRDAKDLRLTPDFVIWHLLEGRLDDAELLIVTCAASSR
jgi:hypothetical protein